ncbi:MAG: ACP S-malonyltransferase [Bryobacteraceae bacterium]|nr:ACP S-malonyltransferase [Bryobacteraceae bacterium]
MTVFQFPGQGSQFAGMGRSLAKAFPAAKDIFDRADRALGFPLSELCFQGPEEALKLTENTQPAILTVSVAAWAVLRERIEPAFVTGHSLGEYSALVAAGSLDFEDAVRIVRLRGRYMQEAVPAGAGAMAALRVAESEIDGILGRAAQGEVLQAANFNAPDQVVIAGTAAAVDRALTLARGLKLPVSAPFHCDLMKPAQERLAADLAALPFADLKVPSVNNVRAELVRSGGDARQGLIDQVPSSVRWTDAIRLLRAQGATTYIEIGPKAVLTGLLKKIDHTATGLKFGEAEDLDPLLTALT